MIAFEAPACRYLCNHFHGAHFRRAKRHLSTLSLVDLSLASFSGAKSQVDLVDKLVQVGALETPSIIHAFKAVDRLRFLDPSFTQQSVTADGAAAFRYAEPYENVPQKLSGALGSTMSTPHHHAVVAEQFSAQLVSAQTRPINVVDIGAGSGYLTAVFAEIVRAGGGRVVGVECAPELVELSAANCRGYENVTITDAFLAENEWNVGAVEALSGVHIIHLGFAATQEVVDMFLSYLSPGGALVVPLQSDTQSQEQQLVRYDLNDQGLESTVVMPVLCQPMQSKMAERSEAQEPLEQRLQRVQEELADWRKHFAEIHGYEPTRDDMFVDEKAAALFETFTRLRKRVW